MVNDKSIKSVSIVGTGRLAHAVITLFKENDFTVDGIWGRNDIKANKLAKKFQVKSFNNISELNSEWIVVCVSDDAIPEVIQHIKRDAIVSLTSGAIHLSLSDNLTVFYPLQTFNDELTSLTWSGIPIVLDGPEQAVSRIKKMCQHWNLQTVEMDNNEREKLHLIAVFFNNFSNHILFKAQELSTKFNISPIIFKELLNKTFNSFDLNNKINIQTGPAVREDQTTLEKHRSYLEGIDLELYNVLTRSIINTKHELQTKTK